MGIVELIAVERETGVRVPWWYVAVMAFAVGVMVGAVLTILLLALGGAL